MKQAFIKNIVVTGVGALALAGCAALGALNSASQPPPETYDLSAPKNVDKLRAHTRAQLLVLPPLAIKALNTENIVVRPAAGVIAYMHDAQWPDTLPRLLQARIIETLENTGRIRAVAQSGEGLSIDDRLTITIRAFEITAFGQPSARVSLFAKIVNDTNGNIRASQLFETKVRLPANYASARAAKGLNSAAETVLGDLARWVVGSLS